MKKAMCMVLVLAMLALMLVGCGGRKDPGGTIISNDGAQDTKPTGVLEPEPTTEATEPTTEATEPSEEESNLSLGRQEGGTYINEYAGFSCTLDSSWQFYTAQELQELPEQISEATKGSELDEYLSGLTQFTDMMAENVDAMTSMNVLYQRLSIEQRLAFAVASEEDVIDAVMEEAGTLTDYYASAGITVKSMEKVKVSFLGQEHYAIYSVMDLQGIPYYTLQLMDGSLGEYSVTLTLASYVDDNTQSLLELFSPLK